MKKLSLVVAVFVALAVCTKAKAQTSDYFPGKWKLTIYGTPAGDSWMELDLQRKDGKLVGSVLDSTGKEMSKLDKVEEKDKDITFYYTSQGFDVSVLLQPIPADSVKGSLLNMFDVKGVRLKQNKQ